MPTYDTYIELLTEEQQTTLRKTYHYRFRKHIAVKGFQKLINQWVKCFLTTEGSNLSDSSYGTRVPLLIGSNITSRRNISDVVQAGITATNDTIFLYQSDDPPDDDTEILEDASLQGLLFSSDGTGIEIYVELKNQAGELLVTQIPPLTLLEG